MNQSGAGLWWSLWVPCNSGYSLICCTKTKRGSQRASPEDPWIKSVLSSPPSLEFVLEAVRLPRVLWVLCPSSLCPMNRSSAGHTGCPRPPRAPAITPQLHLLCHWKVLPGLGCAAVPGCVLSKSTSCLCQDAKLFTALMHWAVPSCPWKHSLAKYTPSQKRSQ